MRFRLMGQILSCLAHHDVFSVCLNINIAYCSMCIEIIAMKRQYNTLCTQNALSPSDLRKPGHVCIFIWDFLRNSFVKGQLYDAV